MNNTAIAVIKIVVMTGGAIAGALLARWLDDTLTARIQEQAAYDRARYAQGLTPLSPQPPTDTPR